MRYYFFPVKERIFNWFLLSLLLYGIFYLTLHLSPSSYGIMLDKIGATKEGLIFGTPQDYRSDEWAVITPLTQSTVNNDFKRFNHTSIYQEDLRTIYALPLKDWGMVFKPTLLGFHFLPPDTALSLHYFLLLTLCLTGFFFFFQQCGLTPIYSLCFSFLVYFSGFTQYWWTTLGPILAYFPWLFVLLRTQMVKPLQYMLLYYVACCMSIAFFYPPLFASLFWLLLILFLVFCRDDISQRRILMLTLTIIAVLGTLYCYFEDMVTTLLTSFYPNQRISVAGTDSKLIAITQFFPTLLIHNHKTIYPNSNICEIGTVGSLMGLALLCFSNWQTYIKQLSRSELSSLLLLAMGLAIIWCWMYIPIPFELTHLLGLTYFPSHRWLFASGVLLLVFFALIIHRVEVILNIKRLLFFTLLLGTATYLVKIALYDKSFSVTWQEFTLPTIILLILLMPSLLAKFNHKMMLITAITLHNVIIFGAYNPLQSTTPIFDLPKTSYLNELHAPQHYNKDGYFLGYLPGATANGLGLPAVTHVLIQPQLDFFKPYFGDLPAQAYDKYFNRYTHIVLYDDITEPHLLNADLLALPLATFKKEPVTRLNFK